MDFDCKGSENIGRRQVCGSNVHNFVRIRIDNVVVARILYRLYKQLKSHLQQDKDRIINN